MFFCFILFFLIRQRRWWNAYILFYEKVPIDQSNPVNNMEKNLSQLQLCMLNKSIDLV